MKQKEFKISLDIAKYLKAKKIMYRFDIADMKLTMNQAVRMKKLQMDERGYPDLFICEPVGKYHGMYIEVKKDISEVFKQNGELKQKWVYKKVGGRSVKIYDHNKEQYDMLKKLSDKGYCAVYGFGFRDTIEKIEKYLYNEF